MTHQVVISDLLLDQGLSFQQRRDRIVERFMSSSWVQQLPDWEPARAHLSEMQCSIAEQGFVESLLAVLSEADYHRCLVVTHTLVGQHYRGGRHDHHPSQ